LKILVLAGGLSTERFVSLSSGSLITAALKRRGYDTLMADLYVGVDADESELEGLFNTKPNEIFKVDHSVPDLEAIIKENGGRRDPIGKNVLTLCKMADAVFFALHGAMGENGQLQATLDSFGVRYTGSGYVGSLLAMDKDIAKRLLLVAGVPTPPWVYMSAKDADADSIISEIGLPAVVKPTNGGSSVGVSIVHSRDELESALALSARYEENVLVEKMIKGREFTCGILEDRVLPPVEIIPKKGFYDYENKYQAGATEEICPPDITDAELALISENTKKVFEALRLSGYARIDHILDENGVFWCLEANTLPGMTPTSLLPQEAAAVGIEYDELCERIIMTALKK
jgi:D-alanine-D-alanine ligase